MLPIVPLHTPPAVVIIQADPKACDSQVLAPMGKSIDIPKDALLINSNFFWTGNQIGVMVNDGKPLKTITLSKPRSLLVIYKDRAEILLLSPKETQEYLKEDKWKEADVIQAGPMLLQQGEIVSRKDQKRECFRQDIYRRTNHTAIGITKSNKLLFVFVQNKTLYELSLVLKKAGAVDAINVDGGSSSCMKYKNNTYGACKPKTVLLLQPKKEID